jgi:F0F1-type ATP synthase, gamma subunit
MIEVEIYGALIESEAAEHLARMMAMKNATDNATDVIYNLTLLRNKVRQEKITYELLDMVTAKQSVEET